MMSGKRFWLYLLLGLVLVGGLLATAGQALAQTDSESYAPEEILVKFKGDTRHEDQERAHRAKGAQLKEKMVTLNVDVVSVPKGKVKEKVDEYARDPLVEYAEPNFIATAFEVTNDPGIVSGQQWGMFKVKAADASMGAWNSAKSDASVKVAILDTGIDNDHEDLVGKVVAEKNCTTSTDADDRYGHGTHVAGIAGATTNNGVGVAGLGYNTSLVDAKVLGDDGYGYYSWVANCLTWAADNGAKVANLSLGGPAKSLTLENAVKYAWSKGVVVVAAAGNNGNSAPMYPAYYTNVMAVAATDTNDKKPSWSNYGKWVGVAAPGVDIYSTLPNHTNTIGTLNYGNLSGTSMATPHVAGLAALVWPTSLGGSNTNVRRQIEATADKITGTGNLWKYGRINALRAVTQVGSYSQKSGK